MNKIVILFENYAHYHLARVNAFESLVKHEWEVIGLEITRDGVDYQWKTQLDDTNLSIISILGNTKIDQISLFEKLQRVFSMLNKIDSNILVIAGYARSTMNFALLWSILKNKPKILLSDSKDDDESRIWWKEGLKGFLVKKYSSALVAGNKHKQYLVKLGFPEDAIFMGYDVVDNSVFHPDKIKPLPSPIHKPYFLSINRFVAKKNLPLLITAYAYYHQKVGEKAWDLVLCGDGELRPQLEGLIKQYQLENHVHLPGFLQQNELLPYFAHAQTFIHASTTEQWGLVVNEAMAAGLPVIVSNRCGCFEDLVMQGVNGFGFNPENQEELTNLMIKISSGDVDLKAMGKASLSHIQNYSPDYFAQGLKSAIDFAMNKT